MAEHAGIGHSRGSGPRNTTGATVTGESLHTLLRASSHNAVRPAAQ